MISVEEALEIVGRWAHALPSRRVALGELLGLRLAEDVTSRVDSPPFDKSVVDGFAIATSDHSPTLRVSETVIAGAVPQGEVTRGTTIRVMTGAPVPRGADAVVKWEDCQRLDDVTIRNPATLAKPGSCVLKRGAAFFAGQTVLEAGKRLGPLGIALLAEIGQSEVAATPRPRVGVLPTGDELVAAHEPLGPGQIRNSNGPMLMAAVRAAGAEPVDLGVARDDQADLREKISEGLQCDMLLVSGGVSAGIKDLVPGVLKDLGVVEQFHQVRMKPGKPLWFGVHEPRATGVSPVLRGCGSSIPMLTGDTPVAHKRTLVFGLPGNPVSTFVSFKLFVEPALAALAGHGFRAPEQLHGTLFQPVRHRGDRPTYHPSRLFRRELPLHFLEPLPWRGSADLAALTDADSLLVLPPGDYELEQGAEIRWIQL